MRRAPIPKLSLAAAFAAIGVGVVCGRYIPLQLWEPALPGLLVALSMMGAATLVRLARNAPITTPTAFDDADLKRFFDTLEELSNRLLWLFYQVVLAVILVIAAMVLAKGAASALPEQMAKANADPELVTKVLSGVLAGVLSWLLTRLAAMARGDIGFLRLQREILENALARERQKQADKTVNSPVQFRSPGGYGRAV